MDSLRRLIDFYRVQIELIWNWRRGRRQLIWRAVVSFFVAAFSLALDGIPAARRARRHACGPGSRGAPDRSAGSSRAAVLLALVAPFSLVLMLITALVFQVGVFLALEPFVPGYHLAQPLDALFAALVFAVINSTIAGCSASTPTTRTTRCSCVVCLGAAAHACASRSPVSSSFRSTDCPTLSCSSSSRPGACRSCRAGSTTAGCAWRRGRRCCRPDERKPGRHPVR